MTEQEIKAKINSDPDFINLKRFDYSLKKLLERYDNGVPVHIMAQALMVTEEELELMYQNILVKLKKVFKE